MKRKRNDEADPSVITKDEKLTLRLLDELPFRPRPSKKQVGHLTFFDLSKKAGPTSAKRMKVDGEWDESIDLDGVRDVDMSDDRCQEVEEGDIEMEM